MKPIHFLITAGPTREHFDPIRYVSNRSSGKMGYALAGAAARVGQVTLVSGPTALKPPAGVEFVQVLSAAKMAKAVFGRYAKVDVVIMAAAVCDYRPRQVANRKLKKTGKKFVLELEPTTDILLELGRRKRRQILIGFAAETNDVEHFAQDKLRRKNLDLIVANDTRAFEGETNIVTLIHRDGRVEHLPEMTKAKVAREILKRALAACQTLAHPVQ
ncbi:MAG: Coenzyme A biosynthesis bifunctional protein CoaBC [Verrucomicrobiae bacterium]|nr:Coenzyme A biosynthesis bifunctional protein CoaBC [Verrucomicrobiae bacterium]